MPLLIIAIFIFPVLVMIDFLVFIIEGSHFLRGSFFRFVEVFILVLLPFFIMSIMDIGVKNDCCSDSAVFSPNHRVTIYFLIGLCLFAYFYLSYRTGLTTPIIEIILNSTVLMGIVLNVFIAIQLDDFVLWFFGNVPIIILFLYVLVKNHQLWKSNTENDKNSYINKIELICYKVLNWKLFQKVPLLFIISLPLLIIIISFLMLFGQRPDSFILAFTDTYKHGLSQLNCSKVVCPDGHFLCTIAASGHTNLVKPVRKGIRHGYLIKVNRQLLVSNAFEDLLQEKVPLVHRQIRHVYNVVGGNFAKVYVLLSNKWASDIIYVLMKPLEWISLISLYLFDRHPENRIAKQYLYPEHRKVVDKVILQRVRM